MENTVVQQIRKRITRSCRKDWWVTTVLYALFHTSVSEYLLFKGGRASVKDGTSSTALVRILIWF